MIKQKDGRLKKRISIILLFSIFMLSSCESVTNEPSSEKIDLPTQSLETNVISEKQTEKQHSIGVTNIENTDTDESNIAKSLTVENNVANLYGQWYINSSNATILFNDQHYDPDNPTSDYTVSEFNLDTIQSDPGFLSNYSYSVEDNILYCDTYGGGIYFNYQCYEDGSVTLTDTDSGTMFTLTREMGLSGNTTTELVNGHKYGHRMGNESWETYINSDGSVLAWEGGIVYFTNPADNNYLYCCNEDGSNQKLMVNLHTEDINIMDGWVYFTGYDENNRIETTGVYKMKLDGTKLRLMESLGWAYRISIVDETLYYTSMTNDGNSLYQSDLDGNNRKEIANLEAYGDYFIAFHIYGDYAYFGYVNSSGATILNYSLMRVSLSNGMIETVIPHLSSDKFIVDKDGIFVIIAHDIYHYDMNGTSEAKLIDCYTSYVIQAGNKLIYYGGSNNRGTEIVSISDLQNPITITDFGGKVCYTDKYLYYFDNGELHVIDYLKQ